MVTRALALILLACLAATPLLAQQASAGLVADMTPLAYFETHANSDTAFRERRFAAAESLYASVGAAYPVDGEIALRRGTSLERLGRHEEAIASYATAHRRGVNDIRSELACNIAQLEARLGHRDAAFAWLDTALTSRFRERSRIQSDSAFRRYIEDPAMRARAGMLPARRFTRTSGWRYDIAFYVAEAQRLHVGRARPAYSRPFLAAAARFSRDVPTLSNAQVFTGLEQLSMRLADGHSYVVMKGGTVPIQLYAFSDGLDIVKASGAAESLVGAQVLRIGRVSADSAMQVIAGFTNRDNELTPLWVGIDHLVNPTVLRALGISSDSTYIALEVRTASGTRTVSLAPEQSSLYRKLLPPTNVSGSPPLWLQHGQTFHWLTPLPELNAISAQCNQVYNDAQESISQYAAKVQQALQQSNVKNLIAECG